MKKQTITKIISRMIVSVFLLCLILPIIPINAATTPSMSSLYSNPNQGGDSTYKFKVSDVVTGSLLTSVVGCTGVVNTVSKWMSGLIQGKAVKEAIQKKGEDAAIEAAKTACKSGKASAEATGQSVPTIGGLAPAIDTILENLGIDINGNQFKTCLQQIDSIDADGRALLKKQLDEAKAKNFKEQCFDGIAITLAKNQLTAMARSTMNWINSGYGGNPLFVQNMRNLTYNIEKNVVETGIDVLLAPNNASPYAADFSRTKINNMGIINSSSKFLGNLQGDLSSFISDPKSYYSNADLQKAQDTRTVLKRAQDANNAFARDFSLGGWNGWLALTQREQNNPLGFNMLASQYLSDMQSQVVSDQKAEIAQNNGFMSQKECIQWQMYNKDSSPKTEDVGNVENTGLMQPTKFVFVKTKPAYQNFNGDNEYGVCAEWKTITPGSLIKDKVGNYLNSPDRQLELVKTINDGLNVLFSALISKLQGGGLTSLSDSAVATNWTDNMNTLTGDTNTGTSGAYDNNGAYNNFNLTRDLGNTYIHSDTTNLGNWNADTNKATLSDVAVKVYPKEINTAIGLYPNTAPEIYIYNSDTKEKELTYPSNPFYTVTTAGKTKLMIDGYNGWEVGDRAFWNGSEWQNWKKDQQSPIAKRGVIQLQQDYIVAAKEILGVLPKVMTSMGELDYCIPGPNPSYRTNSSDAQSAYQNWVGTIYTGPLNMVDMDRMEWRIDREDSQSYKKLASIFDNNPNVWKKITDSNAVAWFLNYFGPFTGTKNMGVTSYAYKTKDSSKFEEAKSLQDINLKYVNSNLFQNFYDVFDKMMNKIYFNNMTRQYNDTETSIGVDKNPAYVPMAQGGLDLTKDILYYNDETNQKITDYTNAIAQAKINIAKLQPIRDEVSGIIADAQKRRDDNLIKILNAEAVKTGGKVLTATEYKTKYASCLTEENIDVFDADGIIGKGSKAKENCTDGIDNDLNGLADAQDPACKGILNN
ncbi:MAG: hypothetical protein NTV03_03660 [Candidatus Nomurabacteria bacterium]|nr:hypothetical protein [Candidatus Nomurabacteria bacterium]